MQDSQEQHAYTTTRLPDMIPIVRQRLEALREKPGPDPLQPLKDLFWTDLSYTYVNRPLSIRHWSPAMQDTLQETPLRLATAGKDNNFDIFYFRLKGDRLLLTAERPVVLRLLEEQLDGLFIFSNAAQNRWHFVNVKQDSAQTRRRLFRRITIGPEERLRTASERIALLDLWKSEDAPRLTISQLHERAFDVEAITDKFFKEYRNLFRILQKDLTLQTGDETWAHDYALQFLNRCMFLFFLQRKGWLGEDRQFLRSFWTVYKEPEPGRKEAAEYQKDSFFEHWLQVLFFEAFNRPFRHSRTYFPERINHILTQAPYLNGGLFTKNDLDKHYPFLISDGRFQQVLTFFEGYNFTIAEDSPLDQEVAVDPEMIGKVYESLVNVTTEKDERGEAGIFYTPRVEIDLMCRLSLVDYLTNQLGQEYKQLLYDVVFALEPHEKSEADDKVEAKGLWRRLQDCLRSIRAIDPACGSGSFLVGMLYVLDDLQRRANERPYQDENAYRRKKRIIEESLYGVDAKSWAVHIAELRLWLTLIVEDIPDDPSISTAEGRHVRPDPLLPHLSFKIRQGDSLVQEVGNINMGLDTTRNLPSELRERLNILIKDKRDLFHGYHSRHPKTRDQLVREEFALFCAILDTQIRTHQEAAKKHQRAIEVLEGERSLLDGTPTNTPEAKSKLEHLRQQKAIEEHEVERLKAARAKLETEKIAPFVWDIAFPEVFGEEKERGFTIVIGNPPYVRQEQITNPLMPREEATTDREKQEYKRQLAHAIYQAYPHFFEYKSESESAARKIDAKSDLYIYFYLLGLRLLQPKGSFCFITSNSWLDVGYGKDLQEFLLKYCCIHMILDNKVKRSFISAGINTIIALFSAPSEKSEENILHHLVRFVMFKVPFEDTLSAEVFKEIEQQDERINKGAYRVHTVSQQTLLEEGYAGNEEEVGEDTSSYKTGEAASTLFERRGGYAVNKWGGKYLRAPDIYQTILEKGRGKLVRLGDIAEVRFGIKTGANEFFYLDEAKARQWHIEPEFLQPVIKSPRECKSILIDPRELKFKLFMCHKTKEELKGTATLEYIRWGESIGIHQVKSVRSRTRWWDLTIESANSIFVKEAHDSSAVFYNPQGYPVDCRLYYANLSTATIIYLNSVIGAMLFEIYNRAGLGEGARSLMVADYKLVPALTRLDGELQIAESALKGIYALPPRKLITPKTEKWADIDNIIFDTLHLTSGERNAVYEAVIGLADARLEKADSLNAPNSRVSKEQRKRLDAVYNTLGIWMGIPDEDEEEVDNTYA